MCTRATVTSHDVLCQVNNSHFLLQLYRCLIQIKLEQFSYSIIYLRDACLILHTVIQFKCSWIYQFVCAVPLNHPHHYMIIYCNEIELCKWCTRWCTRYSRKTKSQSHFFSPIPCNSTTDIFTLTLDAVALTLKSAFSSVIAVDTAER